MARSQRSGIGPLGRDWPNLLLMEETAMALAAATKSVVFRIELDTELKGQHLTDFNNAAQQGNWGAAADAVIGARGQASNDEKAFIRAAFAGWSGGSATPKKKNGPVVRQVDDYGGSGGPTASPRRHGEVLVIADLASTETADRGTLKGKFDDSEGGRRAKKIIDAAFDAAQRRGGSKKTTGKKSTAKKTSAKKTTGKKSTAKKSTAKKSSAKKRRS